MKRVVPGEEEVVTDINFILSEDVVTIWSHEVD